MPITNWYGVPCALSAVPQSTISVSAMIALAAGSISRFLGTRPTWLLAQRWLMGTVLAGLAVRMALETRKA
jgi:threonine/homoserine/homoserine lactone efflux protein